MPPLARPKLVPELDVVDLAASLEFYLDVCGFTVRHRRDDEQFAYLELDGAELMLQAAASPGRRFRTAPLERPHGRGVNFQIEVDDVRPIIDRALAAGVDIVVPIEQTWYRIDEAEVGNQQVVIADPDGYLLRFFQDLGTRRA